ncbi:MAG: transcription termination/antitermination NusG family protein, partial [Anaerolineae bacterium]|nr:transcription termination/antitermination NusG family protein [Anaerolineae bacterium]
MTERWYALRSKPHKDDLLWSQLVIREIETFYPRLRVQTVNPRARKVRPYFPGYMFVRIDLEHVNLSSLQWTPGAVGLVSFGEEPAWVPDELITAIRRRVDKVNKDGGELLSGL